MNFEKGRPQIIAYCRLIIHCFRLIFSCCIYLHMSLIVKKRVDVHITALLNFVSLIIQILNQNFAFLDLSLELDNAGSVKRVGGCFKERLRELGGLDAVCELATSCFLNIRVLLFISTMFTMRMFISMNLY